LVTVGVTPSRRFSRFDRNGSGSCGSMCWVAVGWVAVGWVAVGWVAVGWVAVGWVVAGCDRG
jgi:disulfide bond formation protein DsbB